MREVDVDRRQVRDGVPTDMCIWGGESLVEHCDDCDEGLSHPDLLNIWMHSTLDNDSRIVIDHVWAVFDVFDASRAQGDALVFRLLDGRPGGDGIPVLEDYPRACWSTAYEAPVVFTTDATQEVETIVRAWVYRDVGNGVTWYPADPTVMAPPQETVTCAQEDGNSIICDC